ILVSAWTFLEHDLGPLERTVGFFTVYSMAFYVGALPWLYGRIPIFLKKAIVTAGLAASFWVILQLLAATQVVQFETGIVPSMVWWTLCTAIVLTAFAERVYTSSGTTQSPFLPFPSLSFTQTAQQSLEIARDEAGRFRHDFVGTEHALLGLLKLE